MNKIFCFKKQINQLRINKLKSVIYFDMFKLAKEDAECGDVMFSSVVRSSQRLMNLLDQIIVLKNRSPNLIFQTLRHLINNTEYQSILEHLFMVQTLRKIATNSIKPIEYQEEEKNPVEVNRNRLVKTWEDAEKIVRYQQADVELTQDVQLSQKEIQLIKESLLYQKLRPNTKSIFIDMYNEARDSLVERSQYTYVIDVSKKIKKHHAINELQLKKKDLKIKPLWKKLKEQKEQICQVKTRFNQDIQDEIQELEANQA